MNRKAKRNKYRREKAELEATIRMLTLRNAFCDSAEKVEVVTLSAFEEHPPVDVHSVIEPSQIKEYKEIEICRQFAQTIFNNFNLIKKTECGCGTRYDIKLVKQS